MENFIEFYKNYYGNLATSKQTGLYRINQLFMPLVEKRKIPSIS